MALPKPAAPSGPFFGKQREIPVVIQETLPPMRLFKRRIQKPRIRGQLVSGKRLLHAAVRKRISFIHPQIVNENHIAKTGPQVV